MHPWLTGLRERLRMLQRPRLLLIAGLCGAALLILPGIRKESRAQSPPPADGTAQAEQYREALPEPARSQIAKAAQKGKALF